MKPPRWLPNVITVLRILLLPVFVLVAMRTRGRVGLSLVPLLVLLTIGASDILDGFLARRFDLATRAGAVLDAAADRSAQLVVAGYYTFVEPLLPVWFVVLLVMRDLLSAVGSWVLVRLVPASELTHRAHGRVATILVFSLFGVLALGSLTGITRILVPSAALAVMVSTGRYVADGFAAVRGPRSTVRPR